MSDLYRVKPNEYGEFEILPGYGSNVREQVDNGWLVPVELDYEAAYARAQLSGFAGSLENIRWIVDAALGEADDE